MSDMQDHRRAIAEGAERFAAKVFGAARLRALKDKTRGRDDEALRLAGAEGWLSVLAPEDIGGGGQGVAEACLVAESFGRELAPMPYAGLAASLRAASAFASADLTPALEGGLVILPALAIARDGGVRYEKTDGGFHLTGTRRGVFCAPAADMFLVGAGGAGSPTLALLSAEAPGVSIARRRTVDGQSVGDVTFEASFVEADRVLRGQAAIDAIADLRATLALLAAAELLGVMDAALKRTLEHLKTRTQFGKPLGAFQALQFMAVDCYVAMALSRALVSEAARLIDEGRPGAHLSAMAANAKAGDAALALTRAMVQMHGAIGFTEEHDIGLYLKRALTLSAAWGNPAEQRRTLAARFSNEAVRFREDASEDATFRAEVRAWLEAELPQRLRNLPTRPSFEDAGWWHRKLHARGWVAPNWPKEYGGMGATTAQQLVLYEEMGAIGAPEISGQAIYHLGPILQIFGTPEQKARHLPGMVSGETIWGQGYSEPGAGSDLASLRTRAVRDGDDFIVNGSKIWTTWGHYADWMFALVRTNPDVKKQAGITFLLIDLKSPGVTRRPIDTLTGEDEFAEIFFDDVRVPVANVVGEVDGGWKVANAVLEKERLNGANPTKCAQLLTRVKQAAATAGLSDDPNFQDRLMRAEIDFVALCATFAQIVNIAETGARDRGDFAFAKLVSAELQQQLCELLVEACGPDAASVDQIPLHGGGSVSPGLTYLQNRRVTIYGGSAQIQRLLIARRVLGLGAS